MGAREGAHSMAVSGLSFKITLAGTCTKWAEKIVLLPCRAPISGSGSCFLVWMSGRQLRAIPIESPLVGWCGLSHKCVDLDGCKTLV